MEPGTSFCRCRSAANSRSQPGRCSPPVDIGLDSATRSPGCQRAGRPALILGLGTRAPAWPFAATGVAARLQDDVGALPPGPAVVDHGVPGRPGRLSSVATTYVA